MCYNASVYFKPEQVQEQFKAQTLLQVLFPPAYLVSVHRSPHPALPLLTADGPQLQPMYWGLTPSWNASFDPAWAKRMANARVENLEQSKAWKGPFTYRRGVAVVDAFYEWRHQGKLKVPYRIQATQNRLLALGAIWTYNGALDLYSMSVVTVPANPMMAYIHNSKKRMPLCFTKAEDWQTWIHGSPKEAIQIAKPLINGQLEAYSIGKNITRNDLAPNDPSLIEPVDYPGFPAHLD